MWVRGLKLSLQDFDVMDAVSHPMWVRGLKLEDVAHDMAANMSHPMWVRGLKHCCCYIIVDGLCRTPCGCVD